jgi:hypothetical protein
MWTLVCTLCHDVLTEEDQSMGEVNEYHFIDEDKAQQIAARLDDVLDSGLFDRYSRQFSEWQKSFPVEDRHICGGAGTEQLTEEPQPTGQVCGQCDGSRKRPDFGTGYSFRRESIEAFSRFVANSGGFSIG